MLCYTMVHPATHSAQTYCSEAARWEPGHLSMSHGRMLEDEPDPPGSRGTPAIRATVRVITRVMRVRASGHMVHPQLEGSGSGIHGTPASCTAKCMVKYVTSHSATLTRFLRWHRVDDFYAGDTEPDSTSHAGHHDGITQHMSRFVAHEMAPPLPECPTVHYRLHTASHRIARVSVGTLHIS